MIMSCQPAIKTMTKTVPTTLKRHLTSNKWEEAIRFLIEKADIVSSLIVSVKYGNEEDIFHILYKNNNKFSTDTIYLPKGCVPSHTYNINDYKE